MVKDKDSFQKSFDIPELSHFDYKETLSRNAIVAGYPDEVWENGISVKANGHMYADIGTFEPLGNKDSATALYKYDEKNLVTSKG